MVLMDSQVWEPLIKNPALSSLLRVGYRTTQRKRRQMISRLGGAGFIMKKTKQKKRHKNKSTNMGSNQRTYSGSLSVSIFL